MLGFVGVEKHLVRFELVVRFFSWRSGFFMKKQWKHTRYPFIGAPVSIGSNSKMG